MIIVSDLLTSDKMQLSTIAGNFSFWLVYFTIDNLNHETRKKCRRSSRLLLGVISIHKGDNVDVKLDIYHTCLRFRTKCLQNTSNLAINAGKALYRLLKSNKMAWELEITIIKELKIICADSKVWMCHRIIARFPPIMKNRW